MENQTVKTEKLTPALHEAVKCWVLAESYLNLNNDVIDANWHKGYVAECRLFNEFFKKFGVETDLFSYDWHMTNIHKIDKNQVNILRQILESPDDNNQRLAVEILNNVL